MVFPELHPSIAVLKYDHDPSFEASRKAHDCRKDCNKCNCIEYQAYVKEQHGCHG